MNMSSVDVQNLPSFGAFKIALLRYVFHCNGVSNVHVNILFRISFTATLKNHECNHISHP